MGDMSKEPSMEEILSSIKRIIAEEGNEAVRGSAPLRRGKPAPVIDELPELDADEADIEDSLPEDAMPMDEADEILELTQEIAPEKPVTPPKMTKAAPAASADTSGPPPAVGNTSGPDVAKVSRIVTFVYVIASV